MLGSGGLTNQEKMSTWKELIFSSMTTVVGEMNSKLPDVEKDIILENMKAPLIFDEEIAASFLSLTENDEYTMLGNFQELQHFPKLYGYCGQAYVMEKVIPYSSLFPAFVRKLGWTRTVKLAISFLDMVEELETAKGGPLQHCDIQEGNFGIADDDSIKLIDVDLILTKEKANEILPQPNCSSNSDCEFFDCNSRCDVERGRCLGKRITSNLQVSVFEAIVVALCSNNCSSFEIFINCKIVAFYYQMSGEIESTVTLSICNLRVCLRIPDVFIIQEGVNMELEYIIPGIHNIFYVLAIYSAIFC